jgi:hypothetical protein
MRDARLVVPLALALGAALFVAEGRALAQPSPETRAAAAALFEEGRKLAADGKFAEACPKLEDSQKMDPGMGTLFYLSDCYEKIGRTMSAWVGFRDVAAQAGASGQSDREKLARQRSAALEPQLVRLKVVVRPDAVSAGVEVKRDGAVMSPGVFGTAVPLDPGRHVVSAVATGKEAWEAKVDLKDAGQTVTIEVPPLLDKKAGTAGTPPIPGGDKGNGAPPPGGDGQPLPPPITPDVGSRRPWQMPLGIALTGAGAVGLGVGTALGFVAKGKFDDSNANGHCDKTGHCDPTGLDLRTSAVGMGNAATGVFIAGAVLAAGGVVLWITAPSSKSAPAASSAAARPLGVAVGPGSFALTGAF